MRTIIDFKENFNDDKQRVIKDDEFLFRLPDGRFGYVGSDKSKIYIPGITSDMIVDRDQMFNELCDMFNDPDYKIDGLMIPLIYAFNIYGYKTKFSCQGHSTDENWYIMFDESVSIDDVEYLLYDTSKYSTEYNHYLNICFELFVRMVTHQDSSKSNTLYDGLEKLDIDSDSIDEYKSKAGYLSHVRVNKNTEGFIFLDGDNVVGFINSEKKKDEIWLQGIEISKEYQGQGLSKYFMEEAIKTLGIKYLSVNKKNTKAYEIYKRLGFKKYMYDNNMNYMSLDEYKSTNNHPQRNVIVRPLASFNYDKEHYSLLLNSFLLISGLTDNQIIIPATYSIYNNLGILKE